MITKNTKFILLHLYFCLSTPFLLSVLRLENVFIKKLKIFSSKILNNSLFDVNNWFLLSNYNIFIVTFCIIFIIFHINFTSMFCICVHYIISKNQCLQKTRPCILGRPENVAKKYLYFNPFHANVPISQCSNGNTESKWVKNGPVNYNSIL